MMTEIEAHRIISLFREEWDKNSKTPNAHALDLAIQALEKQEKIKEVFTHYAFSGNEPDVINDCISALSEIKAILKE